MGSVFNSNIKCERSHLTKMKFVHAIVMFSCSVAAVHGVEDPRFAQLEQAYKGLAQNAKALGYSFDSMDFGFPAPSTFKEYNSIDLAVLRSAGFSHIADALVRSSEMALKAGQKGYEALNLLVSGQLKQAKEQGDVAYAESLAAMRAVPSSQSIPPGTITSLRASGHYAVADSLANVKRLRDSMDVVKNTFDIMAKFGGRSTSTF